MTVKTPALLPGFLLLSHQNHSVIQKKTMEELERKSAGEAKSSDRAPVIVILDDVRSMHNVGSVFRTCDAFAVECIYLCGFTPNPPHRDIHKTALGATESVPWRYFDTTEKAVAAAREAGYKIMAVEQAHNSIKLNELNWRQEKTALVFGNEVTGVNDQLLATADGCIEIPQWGAKHSLNISVSAGVVLWEMIRNG
jgi:23S rRNA (guanosine2251-2'-O)-methyltransferase